MQLKKIYKTIHVNVFDSTGSRNDDRNYNIVYACTRTEVYYQYCKSTKTDHFPSLSAFFSVEIKHNYILWHILRKKNYK